MPANDVDFFLNGQMEVRKRYTDYVNSGGDIKGPYGHIIGPDVRLSEPAVVVTDQPVLRTKN
jgi:pilus assembly protein CpaC